jgi:glycosyltransferase involved in cell wall biosynthesis
MMRRYGIETLLEAVALLRGRIPGIELDIIGDGEYRPALETRVEELNLQSRVRFAGFIPAYEDVAPRLLQADLGVVPIWSNHQLCNKLVDYLALGMPAVTTESAALRPYLDDTEVRYVEPKNAQALADAIMELYLHPERRAALGAAGRAAYLEHFAWERARASYLAVYEKVDHALQPGLTLGQRESATHMSADSREASTAGRLYA